MFSTLALNALRSFEAAARLGSFKTAAEELSVTPAAISHQVKALEARLGTLLFERSGQGVALTEQGEQLYRQVHQAFLDISRSLEHFLPKTTSLTLTLTTTPGLAASWLIPRLALSIVLSRSWTYGSTPVTSWWTCYVTPASTSPFEPSAAQIRSCSASH